MGADPPASQVRPADYTALADPHALSGMRLGVPRMYINSDTEADAPIATRASVIDLWQQAQRDLEALGAEVIEVDFPVVSNYENDRPGARSMVDRGLVPEDFAQHELVDLSAFAWDDFLQANADPALPRLADVDGVKIFPQPTGALDDRYGQGEGDDLVALVEHAAAGMPSLEQIPHIGEGVRGLEEARRTDFEQWLRDNRLDAVVFPAVADVAPADADVNPASAAIAWRNGTWVANGNQVIRHLGIPTVTVPMGTMADIGMPVGLTFAGPAYGDNDLLRFGYAFEASGRRRATPPRTPALPDEVLPNEALPDSTGPAATLSLDATMREHSDEVTISIRGHADARGTVTVWVNGVSVEVQREGEGFKADATLPRAVHEHVHSEWRGPYGSIVTAIARGADGCLGAYTVVGGIE